VDVGAALVIAYLLGSLPTAVLVARIATRGAIDIRQAGSGNPGALNTLGVLGAKWGAVVLVVDVGKAAVACVIGRNLGGGNVAYLCGSAAVIGHCFPVWTRFRGGKGVACTGGQCLATFPLYSPIALLVAVGTSRRRLESRSFAAASITMVVWMAAAALWIVGDLPNAWGPKPTWGLLVSAAISGFVIVYKFTTSTTTPRPPVPATS
jgi:acyl phosphate:glycerol-3-phosphate acyltransferase